MHPDDPLREGGQDEPASAPRPARDYSQRPQKSIKLKPGIAKERPGPATRAGPPRQLLGAGPPADGPSGPAEPPAPDSRRESTGGGLPGEIADAVTRAAALAGLTPTEWVARAGQALAATPARDPGPVTTEEVVLFTLREMNQRLAVLERRRGVLAWLRRLLVSPR